MMFDGFEETCQLINTGVIIAGMQVSFGITMGLF